MQRLSIVNDSRLSFLNDDKPPKEIKIVCSGIVPKLLTAIIDWKRAQLILKTKPSERTKADIFERYFQFHQDRYEKTTDPMLRTADWIKTHIEQEKTELENFKRVDFELLREMLTDFHVPKIPSKGWFLNVGYEYLEYCQSMTMQDKIEIFDRLDLIFDDISKYKKIMEILVSQMLIHPNTYIWKDEKKSNKRYLAALIKDLHVKGYYKNNKRPTNLQIESICKNSFGWSVGIDTIKHSKATDFDFFFIPIASTLK